MWVGLQIRVKMMIHPIKYGCTQSFFRLVSRSDCFAPLVVTLWSPTLKKHTETTNTIYDMSYKMVFRLGCVEVRVYCLILLQSTVQLVHMGIDIYGSHQNDADAVH